MAVASFIGLIDDVVKGIPLFGRLFGPKRPDYKGRNGGSFGSPEFFQDARAGRYEAVAALEEKGYGHAWNRPFLRDFVEKEIGRNRVSGKIRKPSGLVTGDVMHGYGQFADNIWGKQARTNLAVGVPLTALMMFTAPKGKIITRGVETAGGVLGSMAGGAVGGLFFGPVGAFAGQMVGGEIGTRVGAVIEPLEKLGHQAYHLNFGGEYHDTEIAWTMRQRAVQEMGSSALNARQYLGKEAALFHQ
jgi:hypothetical protein